MTIEIRAVIKSNDSIEEGFGCTVVKHKETDYLLAMIDPCGDIVYTCSPLGLRPDECLDDLDFGELAKKVSERGDLLIRK